MNAGRKLDGHAWQRRQVLAMAAGALAGSSWPARAAAAPQLGVGAHLWGLSEKEIDQQIDAAKAARLSLVRWDVPWRVVEQQAGRHEIPQRWDYIVDRLRAQDMESMLILDYGNKLYDKGDKPVSSEAQQAYASYAAALARHFAGRVRYYEVWNEWNSRIGGTSRGRSEDYAALARKTYGAIKGADKAAQVIVGALSSSSHDSLVGYGKREASFQVLLGQGIGSCCDAISIHPYVVYREDASRSLAGFDDLLRKVVAQIRATPGLASKPIFVTEIGWSTASQSRFGVSEDEQAQYIQHALQLAGELNLAMVVLYELRDNNKDATDTEGAFGLLRFNMSPKPAYRRLQSRPAAS